MTAVKICGITRLEDARFAVEAGADALGFIFYPPSPRYVAAERAKAIIDSLPDSGDTFRSSHKGTPFHGVPSPKGSERVPGLPEDVFPVARRIAAVGVFVNESVKRVKEIASFCGLDLIQFHGNESTAYCRRFPPERIIKAFALKDPADLESIGAYAVRAVLVDTHDPNLYGGTGRTSNWNLAAQAKRLAPLILSGGLHRGNICEALAAVDPAAVDINSGVEISPGIKDHDKIKTIIQTIRTAT